MDKALNEAPVIARDSAPNRPLDRYGRGKIAIYTAEERNERKLASQHLWRNRHKKALKEAARLIPDAPEDDMIAEDDPILAGVFNGLETLHLTQNPHRDAPPQHPVSYLEQTVDDELYMAPEDETDNYDPVNEPAYPDPMLLPAIIEPRITLELLVGIEDEDDIQEPARDEDSLDGEPEAHDVSIRDPDDGESSDDDYDDDAMDIDASTGNVNLGARAEQEASEYTPAELAFLDEFMDRFLTWQGCDDADHDQADTEHEAVKDTHYGIEHIATMAEGIPNVMDLERMPSIMENVPAATWRTAFTGLKPAEEERPIICLECEDSNGAGDKDIPIQTRFDIDSVVGYPLDLAFAKSGINISFVPLYVECIRQDIHLKESVSWSEAGHSHCQQVMLRDIPHIRLGNALFMSNLPLDVFVFFPNMYAGKPYTFMMEDTIRIWIDEILQPAIFECTEATEHQHYPTSYLHAKAAALAASVEARSRETSTHGRLRKIHHVVAGSRLANLWNTILSKIHNRRRLHYFHNPFLFISGKSWKLTHKSPTFAETWADFSGKWDSAIDNTRFKVGSLQVDVAKELGCSASRSYNSADVDGHHPQTLLWRDCCLTKYLDWRISNADRLGSSKPVYNRYNACMLKDAVNLTIARGSIGVGPVYSQFYNVYKSLYDANKVFPFSNRLLESMSVDAQTRVIVGKVLKVRNNRITLEKAYCASKHRLNLAMTTCVATSYGTREEHRISWQLACQLAARPAASHHPPPPAVRPYYRVSTPKFANYMLSNVNKFCAAFEYGYANSDGVLRSWNQTSLMVMYLKCIRVAFGSILLRKEWYLWRDKKLFPNGHTSEGMGFGTTIKTGYAWLSDKVDYETQRFKAEHIDNIGFSRRNMFREFKMRWKEIQPVIDDISELEQLESDMETYAAFPRCIRLIQRRAVHLCVRAFKREVACSIPAADFKPGERNALLHGNYPLCMKTMKEALKEAPVPLYTKPRAAYNLTQLMFLLFGPDNGEVRKWGTKAYRELLQMACDHIGKNDPAGSGSFRAKVIRTVKRTCWLLPGTNTTSFFPSRSGTDALSWLTVTHEIIIEARIEAEEEMSLEVLGLLDMYSSMSRYKHIWRYAKSEEEIPECPPASLFMDTLGDGREVFEELLTDTARGRALTRSRYGEVAFGDRFSNAHRSISGRENAELTSRVKELRTATDNRRLVAKQALAKADRVIAGRKLIARRQTHGASKITDMFRIEDKSEARRQAENKEVVRMAYERPHRQRRAR